MKKINIILAFVMIMTLQASAQQVFSSVARTSQHNQETLTFTLPSEVNVRHYRIEASDDNTRFDVIGVVASRGNSVLGTSYSYVLHNDGHKYYRVGRTGMNGSVQYSNVVGVSAAPVVKPVSEPVPVVAGAAIVAGK